MPQTSKEGPHSRAPKSFLPFDDANDLNALQGFEAATDWVKKILLGKVKVPPIKKDPIPVPSKLPDVDIGPLSRKIDSLVQKAVLEGAKMSLDDGIRFEAKTFGECLLTKDMRIGMENFIKNGPRVNAPFVHE